jgi:c-di-GMP-binding flagellar brake protein YcgR
VPTLTNSPDPPPLAERRPKPRKRVIFGGRIVYQNGERHFDCTIRDISETGAKIALKPGVPIPSSVYLIDIRSRIVHEAKVMWNNGREAGLQFLSSFAVAAIEKKELLYLKRLCP